MQNLSSVEMFPLGDSAIIIQFDKDINIETHFKVKTLTTYLNNHPFLGMMECVPAFTTVTVFYDAFKIYNENLKNKIRQSFFSEESPYSIVKSIIEKILVSIAGDVEDKARIIEIPVCYGGEFGPDLEYVAKYNGITTKEVIDIHSGGEYLVYMIGFAPGFPYLGGMSGRIATPRRESPRLLIPAGTVGIAGTQTGVYPIGTPGGWQLIGRTPLELFRPKDNIPSLLSAGDIIKFKAISLSEYNGWKEEKQ